MEFKDLGALMKEIIAEPQQLGHGNCQLLLRVSPEQGLAGRI